MTKSSETSYDISNHEHRFQSIALTIINATISEHRARAWCLMLSEIPGIQNAMQYLPLLVETERILPVEEGSHGESIIRHGGIMVVDANNNPILFLSTREVLSGTFNGCIDLTLTRTLPDGSDVQIGLLYTLDPFSKKTEKEFIGRFRGFDITVYDQNSDYIERALFVDGKAILLKSATDRLNVFSSLTEGTEAPSLPQLLADFLNVRKPFDVQSSLRR